MKKKWKYQQENFFHLIHYRFFKTLKRSQAVYALTCKY
jgi:hypothetical protein